MTIPEWLAPVLTVSLLGVVGWAVSTALRKFNELERRLDDKAQSIDKRAQSVDQSIREAIKPDLDNMHEELKGLRRRMHHASGIIQFLAAKADIDPRDFDSSDGEE